MSYLSLPFPLARNNGEAVTNATEIDVTTVGGQTIALSELIATLLSPIFQFVDNLPTASAATMGKIYIVPKDSGSEEEQNIRDEFITLDNGASTSPRYLWEHIGDLAVDLSGYATTDEVASAIATALASYVTTTVMNAELANKVDKVTGKVLSTNDYTDADKAIVDGVTTALNGKVDKVTGKGLSTNDYTDADKAIVDGATTALNGKVDKVTGKGLSTNDYTAADKAIVDGVATALDGKVDKVSGKGLSTNDYTTADMNKLADIDEGAQVNVQPDWNQTNNTKDDYIKNKPTSLPASDVSDWAKASSKPSYTASEVGVTTIPGLAANNVQTALVELLGLRDAGQWYCGTAVTEDEQTESSSAYKVKDLYLNTSTGDVYQLAMTNDVKKWGFEVNIVSRVALTITTTNRATQIVDGYSHAYLDITNGGVQTPGTDDLMAPANAVLDAIDKIMNPSTASSTASSATE